MTGAFGATVSTVTRHCCRRHADIAGWVGRGRRQAVGTVHQRGRRVSPRPTAVCRHAAQERCAVIDLDRCVRLCRTGQRQRRIIADSSPTTPLSVENEAMVGATGATVSMVTLIATEGVLVTPDTVSVAVKLCTPSGKGTVVKLQAPLAFAVAVPSSVVPS